MPTALPWEHLARAEVHPLRISILEVLAIDNGRAMSPKELSFELQERLGNTAYHVKELARLGLLELAATEPRRGAVEHYYRAVRFDGEAV